MVEVRKVDGTLYPPKTIRQLVLLLQMYLNENGRPVKFLSQSEFSSIPVVLDNVMKRGAQVGMGLHVRKAEVISVQKEEILWSKGLLGCQSPQILLDTMVFLCGLHFALRSGDEHRQLSRDQLHLHENDAGRFLEYTEKMSKNNRRGLKDYQVERKVVRAYEDHAHPDRCIVKLYEKYLSLCPDLDPDAPFYLQPLKKPRDTVWYSSVPVGRNTLFKTVGRICSEAGFDGKNIILLFP
jgi:hypothetical protein